MYYSEAAALLRVHGAVDVALEPVEELALVARDREVEELAVRLEVGDTRRRRGPWTSRRGSIRVAAVA